MKIKLSALFLALSLISISGITSCYLIPKPRGPKPKLSRECTPEQEKENFDCKFYGFSISEKGVANYVGGGDTECDCIRALADKADEIWNDGGEPLVVEPCNCTIKR